MSAYAPMLAAQRESIGLSGFVIYATWAAFQGNNYH